MKKWKAILLVLCLPVSVYIYSLRHEVNNADETVDEKDKNTKDKEKDTNENTAVEDETMEEKADNDGEGQWREHYDSGTDNNEMSDGNITVTPAGNGNNGTAAPGAADADRNENDGTVSGELGDSVKDLGDGVSNAVDDIGNAVGNAVEGR